MLFEFAKSDLNKKGELYLSIYKKIKQSVESGALKKGEKLPSVRDAARQLGVSRTTVENAYTKLCIEGIAESLAQKGYFILGIKEKTKTDNSAEQKETVFIKYDFSGEKIDTNAADTDVWKKMIRSVLWDTGELNSYGNPQGEEILRNALSSYAYKSRGVIAEIENIVIGAGIGPLLNILCSILGRDIVVGIENGGFSKAESVFSDYGIKTVRLDYDKNGATMESINKNNIDVLFLMPSSLSKISVASLAKRRNEYENWAKQNNKIIIEDDYNGELRYTARSVPAFQNKLPESCIYIGSFSKLLLPSVRIAYMVLPFALAKRFKEKQFAFNQTCGKVEQLALEKYISNGNLEKHLRKLRRLYYNKSQILYNCLDKRKDVFKSVGLYETSLAIEVDLGVNLESREICSIAKKNGIKVMPSTKSGHIRLGFGGISEDDIPKGVEALYLVFSKK